MTTAPLRPAGSIRRRLLVWLLLPLLGLVPLAAGLMYVMTVRPALDSLDRALTGTAVALSDLLVERQGEVSLALNAQTDKALRTDLYDRVYFAVAAPDARLLSGDAPLMTLRPPLQPREWKFFDAVLGGQAVRVAAFGAPCGGGAQSCPVLVAESLAKRRQAQSAVLAGAVLSLLPLALALVLLGAVAVGRGLLPLRRLSADIEHRSLANLQPVDTPGVPQEVAPLVLALNRLLGRLDAASAAQRAFVENAAHQLRTPLTVLRTESELALADPHAATLPATLQRFHQGAERAARLANQLLALARAGSESPLAGARRVDLREVCIAAAEPWVKAHDIGFELATAPVIGHELMLRELVANLLHNACEYAGPAAAITVRTALRDGRAVLEVEDDGPGIAAADRERVWGRFERGRDARGSGSGLGLAIVRDIARAHGAEAELREGAGGGLLVRVSFAAAAPG